MKLCETCGFGLWQYNQDSLTCKHGHIWTIGAVAEANDVPMTPTRPMRAYEASPEPRSLDRFLPYAFAALLGVDILARVLGP